MRGDAIGRQDLAVLLGREEAGHEDVDPHPVRRPLAGEVERQVVHGALRGRVGEDARQRHDAGHRAEIDDRAALAALDEILAEHLAAEEHALDVDAQDAVELLLADVEERRGGVDAGAVDDDVDAAAAREHRVEQALRLGLAGRFGGVEPRLAAGGGDRSRRALALSALRPTRTTSAPAPARPSAMAPQSSPVPPMTTATLPEREKSDSR